MHGQRSVLPDPPGTVPLAAAGGDQATGLETRTPARIRLIPHFAGVLVAAAALVGLLSDTHRLTADPLLYGLLVASVVALDRLSIDLFDRGNISPGSVPTLALAYLFGPLGPLTAELMVAVLRAVRRDPLVRWTFDFGALTLAGAVAAVAFGLHDGRTAVLVGAAVLGGALYYAVNVSLLAGVMALTEGRSPVEVWRERLAWLFPQYLVFGLLAAGVVLTEEARGLWSLVIFGVPVVMLLIVEKQYVNRSRDGVERLRESHAELERANRRLRELLRNNEELMLRMHRSYVSTITSLARTIEAKDPYTGGHTERVAELACLLARELGLPEDDLAAVEVGGIIHDIGKIGVPDGVLLKPGRLTDDEFTEMRRHPEISSYILAGLDLPLIVEQMARNHHERFDGRGYPDGLAGEQIPLAARILTVADALDAMTSDRPYRSALTLPVALAELASQAGSQFCPHVMAALHSCLERDPTLAGHYEAPPDRLGAALSPTPRTTSGIV